MAYKSYTERMRSSDNKTYGYRRKDGGVIKPNSLEMAVSCVYMGYLTYGYGFFKKKSFSKVNRRSLIEDAKKYKFDVCVSDLCDGIKKLQKIIIEKDIQDIETKKEYVRELIVTLRREWQIEKLES